MSLDYKLFGENAILICWQNTICEKTSHDIYHFNQAIQTLIPEFILETVPAYYSLTVFCNNETNKPELISILKKLYNNTDKNDINSHLWEIPVCYDVSFGIDAEKLASDKNISHQQVIKLHSQTIYTVDFLGFLPGFVYLSGLDSRLHTPRLSSPRAKVAKGSIAIGGKQTGVYPQESPAGWHIIGRTKIDFFASHKANPCFLKPMDKIKFIPISVDEFNHD